jgi:hypothetical protein
MTAKPDLTHFLGWGKVGDDPGITCAQARFTGLVSWRNLPDRAMRLTAGPTM